MATEEIEMAIKPGDTNSDRTTPPGKEPSRRRSTWDPLLPFLFINPLGGWPHHPFVLVRIKALNRNGYTVDTFMRRRVNVLPVSANDLENSQAGKAKSLKAFLAFVFCSVIDIPPQFHCALLMLCVSFLMYHQGKTATTPFVSKFGNSTNDASVLSFGEAFQEYSIHMTEFILSYVLALYLAWPLQVGVQICVVLLLIYAPFRFFPEMVRQASGVYVACGSFNLPLFWFATFGGIGLSLFCLSFLLLMIYIKWLYLSGERRTAAVKELGGSLDGLTEILDGVN